MRIDLNCDVGEGSGHDAEILPFVSSANIACGGHAGDDDTMRTTVALARRHGVAIGAHPGYADRTHGGRRPLRIGPAATAELVLGQIERLIMVAGAGLHHVKLHGALYHQVEQDADLTTAIVTALLRSHPRLILYALAGGRLAEPAAAAARAIDIIRAGRVTSTGGVALAIRAATLCIHGDGGDPVGIARAVRHALDAAGVRVITADGRSGVMRK